MTNIGAPADVWVRVEASIVFDAKTTPHPEILAAEIATDELAYLRTIAIAQLEGPIGLENIRQDLDRPRARAFGRQGQRTRSCEPWWCNEATCDRRSLSSRSR